MWQYASSLVVAAAMLVGFGAPAHGADKGIAALTEKPIELIVPWGTGGGSDQMARALAHAMEKQQPGLTVAVLNKPGGNGTLGLSYALSQPANGRTVALVTNDFMINRILGTSSIKPEDFDYVGRIVADVEMLFVRTDDTRFRSFAEYVKESKAKPRSITIATAGANGVEQLAMTLLNKALGIEVKWIPFDKPAERVAAFLGGHVDLMVEEPSDMKQYIAENKMRPLVQLIEKRTANFPDTPSAKEVGADVSLGLWRGLAVKHGTDPALLAALEGIVAKAVVDPEFMESYIRARSLDIRPGYLPSTEFRKAVASEYESMAQILKGN